MGERIGRQYHMVPIRQQRLIIPKEDAKLQRTSGKYSQSERNCEGACALRGERGTSRDRFLRGLPLMRRSGTGPEIDADVTCERPSGWIEVDGD